MSNVSIKKIVVIIPFYGDKNELDRCIECLKKQSYKPLEIYIRDNNKSNIYFTAAVNQGLKKYCYQDDVDFVFVLNQNAYVHYDTISHLVQCMEKDEQCGIACPLQIREFQNIVSWGGSYEAFPFGRHKCLPLNLYQNNFETYWANGAAMLLRVSMVREIGLFDENMKFICSDSDYSFTARSRGWKIIVSNKAKVFHELGTSSATANADINRIKLLDAMYFANKWLSGDLYRKLSYEGSKLSNEYIQQILKKFELALNDNKI